MGTQSVVNARMLLLKIPSATSKTKDRQGSTISFKDALKNATDNAGDINKKGNILPRKVLAGGYRAAIVSSQGQAQKDKANFQEDKLFSQEFPDSASLESENQVQSQVLQAQMIEFLQLIFNLLQSGESLDKLNLEQLFQNSIRGKDFLDLQLSSGQIDMNLVQYLNLNGKLSDKIAISELLQNIVQKIEQKTQNQQVLGFSFVQGNGVNTENIFKLLEEFAFEKKLQESLFEGRLEHSSLLESLKNLLPQEGQGFEVLSEADKRAQLLKQILKEIEDILKTSDQKIQSSVSSDSLEKIEIGEKVTSNFNGIGSNRNDLNKAFSTLLAKENDTDMNDRKGDVKTEVLDLRQHIFVAQDRVEDISNSLSFQDDKRMKEIRMSIISQLAEKISVINKQNLTTLQVSIKPEWLGSVVIELSKDSSGKIFGNLIVTSPQVKEIIEGSLGSLLTILKDQGINISQLNVSLGGNSTGQQYQEQQRFSQRRNLVVQGNEDSSRSIESLIYEMSEGILNLRA